MTAGQLYDKIIAAMSDKEAIDLIEQTRREWLLEEIIKEKSLTEHLSQEERNEYFDLIIRNLMNDKT
jgi:hypothetical protein